MSIASDIKAITQPLSQLLPGASSSSGSGAAAGASSTGGATDPSTTAGAQKSLAGDQQMFLTLLTAQLKNQDPLSPMDTGQFTQQLVAMTGVQQQIQTNQLLQKLVSNQGGVGDPVGLIGKTVTATTNSGTLQKGQASWLYSIDGNAKDVILQVTDSFGRVVSQTDAGQMAAGEHAFSWNGKNLLGQQLTDGGSYTLSVNAVDTAGTSVPSHTYQRGPVQSVEQNNGQTLVNVGGVDVPVSSITTVGAGA